MEDPNTKAKEDFEAAKTSFDNKIPALGSVTWEDIPEAARNFIAEHPCLTAFQIISIVVAVCPGLVAAPLLGLAGFSNLGPVAGSAAAGFQSTVGVTQAFSTLQSAAMGGYGVAAVHGVVRGVSLGVSGAAQWFSSSKGGDVVENKGGEGVENEDGEEVKDDGENDAEGAVEVKS